MFSTFTGSIKVACKVPYKYSKCSLNVSTFTDSVKVTFKVPYRHSKCNLNVSMDQ